ncbi:hypothetical protein BDF20DRAFT_889742 [Mycotypha africana]|uniref:uncharacterized protein n=1 Tax=Mycotypha africana TaxID=64632 RepID=UPI00230096BE|nr:uncharacterized protein BDF20DRAFT_889742 [Mycotypha africana]KAI8970184.1 hypothetical protein BDF20DRAFT_889742 [Mycotypha africana]
MTIPCLPNRLKNSQVQQSPVLTNEPHAFELTWRNYLPSFSQFCCCLNRRGNIRLSDDDDLLIVPPYYNDQTLYRGEEIQTYLINPRDSEFDSILSEQSNGISAQQFLSRNPFGYQQHQQPLTKKKKKKKVLANSNSFHKKNRRGIYYSDYQQQQHQYNNSSSTETDTLVTVDDIDEENVLGSSVYYHNENNDAEFLPDDLIARLIPQQKSKVPTDTYAQSDQHGTLQGTIVEETHMGAQFSSTYDHLSTFRSIPDLTYTDDDTIVTGPSSTSHDVATAPIVNPSANNGNSKRTSFISIEAAQLLLSDKLDDLTEKLTFIKKNIMQIPTQSKKRQQHQNGQKGNIDEEEDEEFDRTTLYTLHRHDKSETESIISEVLDTYANTDNQMPIQSDETIHIAADRPPNPAPTDNILASSLFDQRNAPMTTSDNLIGNLQNYTAGEQFRTVDSGRPIHQSTTVGDIDDEEGISVKTVLNMGRKWFGV